MDRGKDTRGIGKEGREGNMEGNTEGGRDIQ